MSNMMLVILIGFAVFLMILLVKNDWTFRMRMKIDDAVLAYQLDMIDHHDIPSANLISVWESEPYEKTLWRLWDWSYTRILPPEKFELIKPYIK